MRKSIGYAFLAERFHIQLPINHSSELGPVRKITHASNGSVHSVIQQSSVKPEDTPYWHLEYALKNEGVELAFLAALFANHIDPAELAAWIDDSPAGKHRRRAGFFYELTTGLTLDIKADRAPVPATPALPPEEYVTSPISLRNKKWAVEDNLLGCEQFCPMVRRTQAINDTLGTDYGAMLTKVIEEYPKGIYERSLQWLYRKETKGTFAIESEEPGSRETRFIALLASAGEVPLRERLSEKSLIELQKRTLKDDTDPTLFGLRKIQNSVVRRFDNYYTNTDKVEYLSPPPEKVSDMLSGIVRMLENSKGTHSVIRAACASFGFVYCHPLEDGNGRIHRFLMHDILAHDGVFAKQTIVPISAQIHTEPLDYDKALEALSKPVMAAISDRYDTDRHSGEITIRPAAQGDAAPLWFFPDLTHQCEYFAETLRKTLTITLASEMKYLAGHDTFINRVKEIADIPDNKMRHLVRMLQKNRGEIPKAQRGEIPMSATAWSAITKAFFDSPLAPPRITEKEATERTLKAFGETPYPP